MSEHHNRCSPDIAAACARFVMWALMEGPWQGADVDGAGAQDKAEELGLITATTYDPEKHGSSAGCDCEAGDAWYVPSGALMTLLSNSALYAVPKTVDELAAEITEEIRCEQRARERVATADEVSGDIHLLKVLLSVIDSQSAALREYEAAATSVSSTYQLCAKCGCETKGEAALVGGDIWCHPCADNADTPAMSSPDRGGDA